MCSFPLSTKKGFKLFYTVFLLFFCVSLQKSCVTLKQALGGPKDKVPPELVATDPGYETVNFKGNKLKLKFNKQILTQNLREELIIMPALSKDKKGESYTYKTSGRVLQINFKKGVLQPNTTYIFHFGKSIKGISEHAPEAKNIVCAFSTGPEIDKRSVEGKVEHLLTQKPGEELEVLLYDLKREIKEEEKDEKKSQKENKTEKSTPTKKKETTQEKTTPKPTEKAKDTPKKGDKENAKEKEKESPPSIFTEDIPRYKTKTDKEGKFKISNIKPGNYRIYVRNSLSPGSADEKITVCGFLKEPLDLTLSSLENVVVPILEEDVSELTLKETEAKDQYFMIKLSKPIKDYTLTPIDLPQYYKDKEVLYSNIINNDEIRVYNDSLHLLEEDKPLKMTLKAWDKFGNTLNDDDLGEEIAVQFVNDDDPEKADFSSSLSPYSGSSIELEFEGEVTTNKPIKKLDLSKIYFECDHVKLPINEKDIELNEHKNVLKLKKNLDEKTFTKWGTPMPRKKPTQIQEEEEEKAKKEEEERKKKEEEDKKKTKKEKEEEAKKEEEKKKKEEERKKLRQFKLHFLKGAYEIVEGHKSEASEQTYYQKDPEKLGIVKGEVVAKKTPAFILQLITAEFKVIKEIKNQQKYRFENIPPGVYKMRILFPKDKDSGWSHGNIRKLIEPDPVVFFPREITVKEKVEVEVVGLEFENDEADKKEPKSEKENKNKTPAN